METYIKKKNPEKINKTKIKSFQRPRKANEPFKVIFFSSI